MSRHTHIPPRRRVIIGDAPLYSAVHATALRRPLVGQIIGVPLVIAFTLAVCLFTAFGFDRQAW